MAENRVARVTGASSGIGRAIALRFGEKAMRVGVVARREERLKEVAEAIKGSGGTALVLPGDVREERVAASAVQATIQAWGRLDVLVNNAGIGKYAPMETLPLVSFREQLEVNVLAPFRFVQAVVPQMKKQGSGQIVNIGSMVGFVGVARGTAYAATKWALRGMTECWREELYPDGIKVAYVAPGYVITEFGGRKEDYSAPEAEWAMIPKDVAHAVETVVDQGPNSDIREIVIQVRDRS